MRLGLLFCQSCPLRQQLRQGSASRSIIQDGLFKNFEKVLDKQNKLCYLN